MVSKKSSSSKDEEMDSVFIKNSRFEQVIEELKFIRSPRDIKILSDKVAFLINRSASLQHLLFDKPLSLQIEPTNYCNVDCICCSAPISVRPRGFMEYELFTKIIDDASSVGVKRIHLYLHGEPLLHPKIVDMIGYIKSKNLAVHLFTNGMILNKTKIDSFLNSGVNSSDYFTVSILGYSKKIHELVMKRVIHEKVLTNIDYFLEARHKLNLNGPIIEVIFQITPENKDELKDFNNYWKNRVDHVRIGGKIAYTFSKDQNEKAKIPLRRSTCKVLWDRMTIYWNGDVTLCCVDTRGEWILGNLRTRSLLEIWRSEQLRNIKKFHMKRQFSNIPICAYCDM